MRIGIDLQVLGQKHLTGVGKYALNISKALLEVGSEHEWVLFVPEKSVIPDLIGDPVLDSRFRGNDNVKIVSLPRKRIPFLTVHWAYARIMQKARLDVLFCPANTMPWFYSGRGVVTIHDLAIYKHPEWFPKGQSFSTRFLVPRSIRRARSIIVPSLATARDLKELFKVPENKIEVIPHGVEGRFFESANTKYQMPNTKYILFVGALEPRKNIDRLIEAYAFLPEDIRDKHELWIVGGLGMGSEKLKVKSEKLGSRIWFLGYVPDEDLPALYQGAAVFVYPSLYEGFGLPVLEAMAAGVPVITSRGTAMEEITRPGLVIPASEPGSSLDSRFRGNENEGAVLVDPHSVAEIRDAIARLTRDNAYSSQISRAGQQLARNYTWERAVLSTLKVLTGYGVAKKSLD